MNCEIKDGVKIWMKKNPPRKIGQAEQEAKKKLYYEPTFGTPECSYKGKKRGRKSMAERECPTLIKNEKKTTILYFD